MNGFKEFSLYFCDADYHLNFYRTYFWKYILKFISLDNKNISEIRKLTYANENIIF